MKKDEYDVIIIGAGIGGLVCGCYLAKAGMKVLIVEKNDKPGGYCTSFERKGFKFDACVHSLGSCRKSGYIYNVLSELDLINKIKLIRYNPSDVVIAPDYRIHFNNDIKDFVRELQNYFPSETSQIKKFIYHIYDSTFASLFINLKRVSFKNFLDSFFKDNKLKAILSIVILGNSGLPPSFISAFTAASLYKEFIFDGGYYPVGGMQILSNSFADKAEELGCKIDLSNEVKRIKFKSGKVHGLMVKDSYFIRADNVISTCSMLYTCKNLIKDEIGKLKFGLDLIKMKPSLSAFSVYLGMDDRFDLDRKLKCNLWYLPNYDIDDMYYKILTGSIDRKDVYLLFFLSSLLPRSDNGERKTISLFVNAPFKTLQFWQKNTHNLFNKIIEKAEIILPNLRTNINMYDFSTPQTLFKYTNNYKGAAYGWMPIISQVWSKKILEKITKIDGLYFAGHWTSQGFGIPAVMNISRNIANLLLSKQKYAK
ncbi:MAG: NAD(P)/FAD-dependent oxidoreductase [Candidatus Omnitrophica bacterium]|nr:NAD(P)/FAD-dependent oxidoreductase [Candidatus Omnitrophota bacterium]